MATINIFYKKFQVISR